MTQIQLARNGYLPTLDVTEPPTHPHFSGRLAEARSYLVDRPPNLFVAEPGRFHLYAGWFSPWSHRSTLVIALAGLEDLVSVSYVDPAHDARGAFTLLKDAYEVTDPHFTGPVTVPTLWDWETRRVVTNDYATLDIDLATEFREWSRTGVELYPPDLRDEIDELDRWLGPVVNQGVFRVGGDPAAGRRARADLNAAFSTLDRRLANSAYLLGDRLTLADIRLWVTLVRYGTRPGGERRISPQLSQFSCLWAYAQDLYAMEAFLVTTDPGRFAR